MDNHVIVSGCSGGGKSSLIDEFRRRGYACVEEPGRRIVQAELERGGSALPWINPTAFARRAVEVALSDLATAPASGWVFFDRGLVDALSALAHFTANPAHLMPGHRHRYHRRVFLTPPWREMYRTDAERRHGFDQACEEYARLLVDFPALGYDFLELPRVSITERADHVLAALTPQAPDRDISQN